ncbi:dTMP kinase [Sphingomonas sp.]|uniref:dTMP kinase n=1 Tax=Sphingomonas sp. TaxID=28214 RepID=UPI0025F3FA44|nr:dTMP kinase [Sphingomonas sp.]MBV9526916.1 dTMP kinase [Sphingomonas sp.]
MTAAGRFISLEGGEGVGKSTQARELAAALQAIGIDVVLTREPGGSDGADAVRELLLSGADERFGPDAEALLFAAARADHVRKTIRPALAAGRWVISDRFIDSSLAYQGGAGGLGIEVVRSINAFALGDTFPDRTLVLLSDEGQARAQLRDTGASDRIGGRSEAYHHKVETAFRLIAAEEPDRVRLVDASGPKEAVTKRLLDVLSDLLP